MIGVNSNRLNKTVTLSPSWLQLGRGVGDSCSWPSVAPRTIAAFLFMAFALCWLNLSQSNSMAVSQTSTTIPIAAVATFATLLAFCGSILRKFHQGIVNSLSPKHRNQPAAAQEQERTGYEHDLINSFLRGFHLANKRGGFDEVEKAFGRYLRKYPADRALVEKAMDLFSKAGR